MTKTESASRFLLTILVIILVIFFALFLPSLIPADGTGVGRRNCHNNLKELKRGRMLYLEDHNSVTKGDLQVSDVLPYLGWNHAICYERGEYSFDASGNPRCSFPGHQFDDE